MTDTANALDPQTAHHHSTRCWWDATQARWVCPRPAPEPERPPVDIRDMLVVHTALLREFRLAPDAVARVPAGARRRAATVDRHLGLLCDLLHHHHAGEDELLWPPLRDRAPARAAALLDVAEAQHAGLDAALERVRDARRSWLGACDPGSREELVDALRTMHGLLAEHLDTEERTLLPLASAHLTEAQWRAVGEAGAAAIAKSQMLLVFGMFAYEGDPEVLATMLAEAPAPVRVVVPHLAPRLYARRAARVHGTPRP
jgi:hypothetical protein